MNEPAAEQPIPDPAAAAEAIRLVDGARQLWAEQKLSESEPPLRRALELAETKLGPDHPHVSVVLSHLGWLAKARERNEEAVADYRRALLIREAWFGPDHPDTLQLVEDLAAAVFQAEATDPEADTLGLRAINAHERLGRDDAALAALFATVAHRRFWIGQYVEAEPMYLRALAMQERLLGPLDASTAETAKRLAMMYDHRGFPNDPLPYYRQAMNGFEAAHGPDDLDTFEARYRLADCLNRRGLGHEAAPLFDQLAKRIVENQPSIEPDEVHWMLGEICEYLREAGREVEVETIEVWASSHSPYLMMVRSEASRAELAFGPESTELVEALEHLANALSSEALADEAEDTARRILAIHQARLGPDHVFTIGAAPAINDDS